MFIGRPVLGCCDITCSMQEISHSRHHFFMDICFQKYYSWHRILVFARNPQASNTCLHLHLKLPFYGIRGWFNVTLRRKKKKKRKYNAWKNSPFVQWEEVAGSFIHGRSWTLGLEKNNPKPNCEVTECPMDPVLLKIILCKSAALQFLLQYWLRAAREDII